MNSCQQKRCLPLLLVAVSFCCSEERVLAQGNFGGFQVRDLQQAPTNVASQPAITSRFQPRVQTFQSPATSHSVARPASLTTQSSAQPVLARPDTAWPDRPVQFDEFVKQANLERSDSSNEVQDIIGSTVDSAGQLLGSWKDQIGQKTNQLLGSVDSESTEAVGFSGGDWLGSIQQKVNSPDVRRMLGSLALVVGGYLALVVVLRKLGGGGQRGIPSEVVSVLGNLPYGHKQNLRLVRLGSKLVLLLNGPDGTHPIGEITDPSEVDYLASLCQGKRAMRPPTTLAASRPAEPKSEPGVRGITEESLSQVLRRLEQATRGGVANYEA